MGILSLPFILLVLLLLFFENLLRLDPLRPLFYGEIRMSCDQKFKLYKFNIFKNGIVEHIRENHKHVETKHLERSGSTTFVGWILKQIYMDELPQIWNVLKGEMSMVGPRPLNLRVYENLSTEEKKTREKINAGITGNFQSHKNNRGMKASVLDKEYFEIFCSKSSTELIKADIKIMLRTIKIILRAEGI